MLRPDGHTYHEYDQDRGRDAAAAEQVWKENLTC